MDGEKGIRDDELGTGGDFNCKQKEIVESIYDLNATDDKNMGCSQENQAEDSNTEEKYDDDEEEEEDEKDSNAEGKYDDDEEDEEPYTLTFEGEINPLDRTKVDANGIHLEHMEYEALAAKKRLVELEYEYQGMPPKKKSRKEDSFEATFQKLTDEKTNAKRRKLKKYLRQIKKRGRRKGSKKKVSPEIMRKLGDATLFYVHGQYEKAIPLLKEIILTTPILPEPYHSLGLIYNAIGNKKRAFAFYMLAVHLMPVDASASFWKLLVAWSMEEGNLGQACYCLNKAIKADREDYCLRYHHVSLFVELGKHNRAAKSCGQFWQLCPKNLESLKTAATLYQKCGRNERSVDILEDYLEKNPKDADLSVVLLLASVFMSGNAYAKALHHIEYTQQTHSAGKELPAELLIKAGICHVHLGNMEKAEAFFSVFTHGNENDCNLVIEVANTLMSAKHHESALKYYLMLEGSDGDSKGLLYLKIGRCYSFLNARTQAIAYFYKALNDYEQDIDVRLELVSLLLEENKEDEAICVLSPPDEESRVNQTFDTGEPWWTDGKIKLKLCYIYKSKGLSEAFVEAIFPLVRETLLLETFQPKGRRKKKLSKSELLRRVKVVDEHQNHNLFRFCPVALSYNLSKAARAKKLLQKHETRREEKRAAASAGDVLPSDDSDDESPAYREPPLPNLLKDEEHLSLIVDLCKELASLQRYWDALEIINSTLKLAQNILTTEKQEELRSLGAQIAYNINDPAIVREYAQHIVSQNPCSFGAWNCFYKIISRCRLDNFSKFLHDMIVKYDDCIPPILIKGHQFTVKSQHQAAARHYLKAYKLMPDNALINLCAGTTLINLALGLRLHNTHQCVLQGLAFLYNNLRLSGNSQEALYNLARAYHHVGLISIAATYYEKVLVVHQKDYPIPRLPNDGPDITHDLKPGYCDLKREAAYNLHLIYKESKSKDLARQVLKDHCSL